MPGRRASLIRLALAAALGVSGPGGCASPPGGADVSPLAGRVFDSAGGHFLDAEALLDALAAHRFVLLGERHDRASHHRLQALVLRGLVARGRRPAVAFEMLSADVAAALAGATATPDASPEAVRRAVGWDTNGWPAFSLYEPVFASALEAGLRLVAADLPHSVLARLGRDGPAGLDPATRSALALDAPVPAALGAALAEDVRAGHCGHLPESALPAMVAVQRARDAQLARALVEAAGDDGAMLIAGAGHVRRDWGVPWWLARHEPGASVAALAFFDAAPQQRAPGPETARYDFVWYTEPEDLADPCETFREQLEALGRDARQAPSPRRGRGMLRR